MVFIPLLLDINMNQIEVTTSDSPKNRVRVGSGVSTNVGSDVVHITINGNNFQDSVSSWDNMTSITGWINVDLINDPIKIEISQPVYVTKDDSGKEIVYYNSRLMEYNKLYEIIWEGEKWALKKTDQEVKFLKWEAGESD